MDIVLPDAIGQADEPIHRIPLGGRKVRVLDQGGGDRTEFRPAAIKIDQVERRGGTAGSPLLSATPTGTCHAPTLMHTARWAA